MTQTEKVDQMWGEYASKVLKSVCILDNHLTLEHLSNHEFTCAQSDSTYFPVPVLKIDERIRQGQGEGRAWARKETWSGRGPHHPPRPFAWPCEVSARGHRTILRWRGGPWALGPARCFGRCGPYLLSPSSPHLPLPHLPPLPPGRETVSLGLHTYISRQSRSPQKSHISSPSKGHTFHILINILHEVPNHQHVAKQKIRKQVAKLFSPCIHISQTYIYIYFFFYSHEYCVYVNISHIA